MSLTHLLANPALTISQQQQLIFYVVNIILLIFGCLLPGKTTAASLFG